MADNSVYRIDIPVTVSDETAAGLNQAKSHVDAFQKSMQKTQQQAMKMQASKMQLTLSVIDKASPVIKQITSMLGKITKGAITIPLKIADFVTAPFRKIIGMLTSPLGLLGLGGGIAGLTAGLVAVPLKLADSFNTAKLAFQQMLGQTQGTQFLNSLQNWAIASPYQQSHVINWGRTLLGSGMSQSQVTKTMSTLSDVSSAMGLGDQGMNTLNTAVSRMVATGRLDAGTLDMFTQFGVPIWQMLQNKTGMGRLSLQRMVGSGVMSTDQYLPMIMDALNQQYGGSTAKMQNETIGGLMSQISDLFRVKVVQSWGEGLQSVVIPKLQTVVKWLDQNKTLVEQWSKAIHDAGAQIGGYVGNAIDYLKGKLTDLTGSSAWQNATSLGDKINLIWNDVIVDSFNKWWNDSGSSWASTAANTIGSALGGFLQTAILGALGADTSPYTGAGEKAGKSFWDGFSKNFDAGKVANTAKDKFIAAQPTQVGGNSDSLLGSGLFDIAAASVVYTLASKVLSVPFKIVKGAFKFGKGVAGVVGAIARLFGAGSGTASTVDASANLAASAAAPEAAAGGLGFLGPLALVAAPVLAGIGLFNATKGMGQNDPSALAKLRNWGLQTFAPQIYDYIQKNGGFDRVAAITNAQNGNQVSDLGSGYGTFSALNDDLQQFDDVIRDLTGMFTLWSNKFSDQSSAPSTASANGGAPWTGLHSSLDPRFSSTSGLPAPGDIAGWRNVIASQVPDSLRNNAEFINTLLAGGLAESGLDPSRVQKGGGGRGFWQFDVNGGMGTGLSNAQLFSEQYQASKIIPEYAYWFQRAPSNLSGADKAAWVAAHAERPYDYQNPYSAANNNYRAAYGRVAANGGHTINLHENAVQINTTSGDPVALSKEIADPLMNEIAARLEKVLANAVN